MPDGGCWFARGLRADVKRRLPHYASDFKDGLYIKLLRNYA